MLDYDASTGIVTLSVPEPSCALLGLLGMAALLAMRRRA
ncbi:MAG: PEP-CTERM sorting domain-containing protein [Akkermansia sp.]|nr:PEP-CTERM sorting domain-containing protein [Akkermansia sp.]